MVRCFRKRYGTTPVQYRLKTRLNRAGRLGWSRPDLTVQRIAEACGVPDAPYFHRQFLRYFGTSPARYRQDSETS
jgi:transcriptional regulator GlxA family with amidase domain